MRNLHHALKHDQVGKGRGAPPARCVHCHKILEKKTKDHVFPSSWYPENTPANVQRWTVPSCRDCNERFGEMEKEVFIRAAMCVGPVKGEAAGLSKRALKSLGVKAPGLSAEEQRHRQALKDGILKEITPYVPGTECLPGLGPHPGFPDDQQYQIRISAEQLKAVAGKIVRGCEYVLGQRRIIEDPYALQIYFADEKRIGEVIRLFDNFGPEHLGPGFQVRRACAHDDPRTALYKIDIWGTWTIDAAIIPEDGSDECPPSPKSTETEGGIS